MQELATLLEQTAVATALRESVWLYPLVNAGHVLGIAMVVGGIIPLDLRLLGLWPGVSLLPFWRVLRTTVAAGLALAIVTGLLLFLTRAAEYLASPWFLSKLTLLLMALINVVFVTVRHPLSEIGHRPLSRELRVCALISLVSWCSVLLLGRLVGYF
ncbi:MAG: hypothetical protein ACQEV6_02445 [Pseudomonadota bacterium]